MTIFVKIQPGLFSCTYNTDDIVIKQTRADERKKKRTPRLGKMSPLKWRREESFLQK